MKKKNIKMYAAFLAVPFAMVAGVSSGNIYADIANIPEAQQTLGFTDENFYKCALDAAVSKNSGTSNPVDTTTGPTAAQWSNVTSLSCSSYGKVNSEIIVDVSGLDILTGLTSLTIRDTKISAIDLSKNTELTSISVYNNKSLTSIDLSKNTKIKTLSVSSNTLDSLDVSKNTELTEISASYNNLSSIDLSQNTELKRINISNNTLDSLDVSKNTELSSLDAYSNNLSSLDVSKNTKLGSLDLDHNRIKSVDVSQNSTLTYLDVSNNELTSANLNGAAALSSLYLGNNNLSSIDVSKNTALTYLSLSNNNLSSIDVSKNTALTYLSLSNNNLSSIDVSKNVALRTLSLASNNIPVVDITNNTSINSLSVDDVYVKTWLSPTQAEGGYQYDIGSLSFFRSRIIEGDGYSYDEESHILSVTNPNTTKFVQVLGTGETGQRYKLVLSGDPSTFPTPEGAIDNNTDEDGETDIKVPDTGAVTGAEGGALAIFAASTAVVLAVIGLTTHLKNRNKDHYVFDK